MPATHEVMRPNDDPRYYPLSLSFCDINCDRIGYLMAHVFLGDIPVAKTGMVFR